MRAMRLRRSTNSTVREHSLLIRATILLSKLVCYQIRTSRILEKTQKTMLREKPKNSRTSSMSGRKSSSNSINISRTGITDLSTRVESSKISWAEPKMETSNLKDKRTSSTKMIFKMKMASFHHRDTKTENRNHCMKLRKFPAVWAWWAQRNLSKLFLI